MQFRIIFITLLLLPLSLIYGLSDADDIFTAVGVQFEICPENYKSEETFFNITDRIISDLCSEEMQPDLVIFPEYIGVFFQLIEYNGIINRHNGFQQALVDVLNRHSEYNDLSDIFRDEAAVGRWLSGWSNLSKKYEVAIISGSCFIEDDNGGLRNRAHVFGADGTLVYYQDKVFLTDFETGVIGLSPGSLDDAGFFQVKAQDIALTICRDAYSTDWEKKNSGAFLWVDIKANGEVYDPDQKRSFLRALPMRMLNTEVNFGMTVCAVGCYLDLFWEGESTALFKTGKGLALADIADSCRREDSILLRIQTVQ